MKNNIIPSCNNCKENEFKEILGTVTGKCLKCSHYTNNSKSQSYYIYRGTIKDRFPRSWI